MVCKFRNFHCAVTSGTLFEHKKEGFLPLSVKFQPIIAIYSRFRNANMRNKRGTGMGLEKDQRMVAYLHLPIPTVSVYRETELCVGPQFQYNCCHQSTFVQQCWQLGLRKKISAFLARIKLFTITQKDFAAPGWLQKCEHKEMNIQLICCQRLRAQRTGDSLQ